MDPELNDGKPAADTTTPDAPDAPEPSIEEAALAAMDAGLAGEHPDAKTETPEPKQETPAADPVPGTPEAAATEKSTAEAGKVDAAKKGEGAPAKPERDEAVEKEITDLGLKEKSAERFRSMASEIKALAPVKEALEHAGIKDVAELPQIVQDASAGREIFQQIRDTGANPEQYGMALDYLSTVTRAMRGDMKAAEQAYAVMSGELTVLAKMLGKDVPGIVDPLADHADLKRQVDDGDLPRESALEIARLRQQSALRDAQQRSESDRQTSDAAQQQAVKDAAAELDTLGQELAKIDPHFAAKAPVLVAQLQALKDVLPPAQWTAKARALYAAIPNPVAAPAAAPAPAKPTPGPIRGNSVRPTVMPVTDDPFEAMEQGIAAATR